MTDAATGRLTVHVLDTARGVPAAGLAVSLVRLDGATWTTLGRWTTNADGRCDRPLLSGTALIAGTYCLEFDVAAWRASQAMETAGFYDIVLIRFRIADPAAHYHVPLLLSPFGYSTYRGS